MLGLSGKGTTNLNKLFQNLPHISDKTLAGSLPLRSMISCNLQKNMSQNYAFLLNGEKLLQFRTLQTIFVGRRHEVPCKVAQLVCITI